VDTSAPAGAVSAAFSADTGTSDSDLVTKVAAQDIRGVLSGALEKGETVFVSLDDGANWAAAQTQGGNWSLAGQALDGSNTLKVVVRDTAGNESAVFSAAYQLDTTAPAINFSGLALSKDSGASASDFVTNAAAQSISASLSAAPSATDKVWGSLDGGATWTDITDKVAGTSLAWDGVTLGASSTIVLKVSDLAGNDGPGGSRAYTLDTGAPAAPTVTPLAAAANAPTLTGTAQVQAGESLTVSVGGATYAVTPAGGNWSLNLGTAAPSAGTLSIAPGNVYTVTATVTDTAGNNRSATGELQIAALPATPNPGQPATPAVPPDPAPVALPAAPAAGNALPAPTISFLSPAAQATIGTPAVTVTAVAASSSIATPSASTPVNAPAEPGLTQGGGSFQVVVVNNSSGSGEGLMVNRGLSDQAVAASAGPATISVPADAFAHTSPNAVIQLSAAQANGRALPNWISFDAKSGKFVVDPPKGLKGELSVRVVARDAQGREVVSTFKIKVGEQAAGKDAPQAARPALSEQVRQAAAQARQPDLLEQLARRVEAAVDA
jgi:hypothetical protein